MQLISTGEASNLKGDLTQWQKYKKSFQKYYQKNKDYYREYQKKYYHENKEHVTLQKKESLRKRLEANPQKIRKQQREGCRRWELKYPERLKECARKYRLENIDKVRAAQKRWRTSLAGRLAKRGYHLKRKFGFIDKKKILNEVLNINFLKYGMILCENCGVACWENYQFDHIISIFLGGKNEFDNFQILCPACNLEKRIYAIDFRREINRINDVYVN